MAKVALTPMQKRYAWHAQMERMIKRHISRRDPEAEYSTQTELAHDLGITRTTLSNIFSGRQLPTLTLLARICVACNISADEVGQLVIALGEIR